MLAALVAGTRDPAVLADLARGKLRQKLPALRQALAGRFGDHHGLLVGQILAKLDFLDEAVAQVSAEIDRVIAPFAQQVALLDTIPGVDRRTAEALIAELGSTWPGSARPRGWRPGRGCAPASTSRPAKSAAAGPARAPSGWART